MQPRLGIQSWHWGIEFLLPLGLDNHISARIIMTNRSFIAFVDSILSSGIVALGGFWCEI
jgi:hypothetical protein